MSDVKATEVKIFTQALERWRKDCEVSETVGDASQFYFLCAEHCSMDVLLKWQEADTPPADMY